MVDPTLVDSPPTGDRWAHEIKWDGYRVQAHLEGGKATIYTRKANDWTSRFVTIAAAIAQLPALSAIVDGEAVALDDEGRPDFHAVGRASAAIVYKAFDLLWLDGKDLRPLPWSDRKRRLRDLLAELPAGLADVVSYVEPVYDDGPKVYAGACRLGLEGIVSKRIDAPYRAGRSDVWRKCRCAIVETMAVVGYSTDERGHLDGLYLARAENGQLTYALKVDTGLTDKERRQLEATFKSMVTSQAAIDVDVGGRTARARARWVRPDKLVDVSHRGITAGGLRRHPRFVRLRPDLTIPGTVRRPPSRR